MNESLKSVCAWCHPEPTKDEKTTHGICEDCKTKELEDFKKYLDEEQPQKADEYLISEARRVFNGDLLHTIENKILLYRNPDTNYFTNHFEIMERMIRTMVAKQKVNKHLKLGSLSLKDLDKIDKEFTAKLELKEV